MLKLIVTNTTSFIEGEISDIWEERKEFGGELRKVLGYQVLGADFSPKFKEGLWDGLITLYQWRTKSFPTGCLMRVVKLLEEKNIEFEIEDTRIKPKKNINLTTFLAEQGKSLYFYQENAVDKAHKVGRGIVAMATGAGKTISACELLARISTAPFLFYVPSISLLRQTHREFSKYLRVDGKPAHIGFIGAGVCDVNAKGINVITYQTALSAFNEIYNKKKDCIENNDLAGEVVKKTVEELQQESDAARIAFNKALKNAELKHKHLKIDGQPKTQKQYERAVAKEVATFKKIKDTSQRILDNRLESMRNKKNIRGLITNARGFLVDEAHVAAVIIESLGNHAANAYWRIGLSATAFREDNQEIRIEGTMGRKLVEITASDLIDLGFLVPPTIYQIKIEHLEPCVDYRDGYRKHIINCWERNYRIKQFAEAFKEAGRPVLILVEQLAHGEILEGMIKDSVFVAGKDNEDDPDAAERDYRRRMLNEVEANNIILIATQWANVGIDAPAISTLILAGSCQSAVAVYQMVGRALRKSDDTGKTDAVIIDFNDKESSFHTHSNYRKRVYERERSWKFKRVQSPK